MNTLGFLDYAWSIFFEKDYLKIRLLVSPNVKFPRLLRDDAGFACIFPEPTMIETESGESMFLLMGYVFPDNSEGKRQLASLFRASVFHLGSHALSSRFEDYQEWTKPKNPQLAKFTTCLIEDVRANAYLASRYNSKLVDVAFANVLALKRLGKIDRLVNPATKCMAGLLIRSSTGVINLESEDERNAVANLGERLDRLKEKAAFSFSCGGMSLKEDMLGLADDIYHTIKELGPITETPFLPHTEELGASTMFSRSYFVNSNALEESSFNRCLGFLSGIPFVSGGSAKTDERLIEAETTQVFDSWKNQKEKEAKMLERYRALLPSTSFRSAETPVQNYTQFLRVKARCKSEAHRLIESLLVARDALDEDPRKEYGVLDLQEIIQVIASKSPRQDVWMLDENLSKSYSWVILLDASKSMEYLKDFALELAIILGDTANETLLDPTSWSMYAFSNRFFIIKDPREQYNVRVKSRIGGIEFGGSTFLSDALAMAGQIVKTRAENMRLITVISDGYQYEFFNTRDSVSETISNLEGRGISFIGIGAKSRRMERLFRSGISVYNHRDLAKKFSNLYLSASRISAET